MTRRLAFITLAGLVSLAGCPSDQFDYKSWTKKLSDSHESERAVQKLEEPRQPWRHPGARRGLGRSGQAGPLPPGHHRARPPADPGGGRREVRHRLREDGAPGELGRRAALPEEGAARGRRGEPALGRLGGQGGRRARRCAARGRPRGARRSVGEAALAEAVERADRLGAERPIGKLRGRGRRPPRLR